MFGKVTYNWKAIRWLGNVQTNSSIKDRLNQVHKIN